MTKLKRLLELLPWPAKLLLQILLVALVGLAIWDRLVEGWSVVEQEIDPLSPQLLLATGLFVVAVGTTGLAWGAMTNQILAGRGEKISRLTAIRVQILSWLLKYIPGQVGSFGSKLVWGEANGYSKKTMLMSVAYENIFLASSSLLLSLPLVGSTLLDEASAGILIPFAVAVVVALLLTPGVLKALVNYGLKKLNKKPADEQHALDSKRTIRSQVWFLIPRIINGLGFIMIASMFASFSGVGALQLAAAYILAGIIGIMAFFVPSGLGVREAVIIIVAGPIIGPAAAGAAAITARLAATIADGVLAVIYGAINFYEKS